jgi:putative membrane protein
MQKNFYCNLQAPLQNADLLSLERNKLSNERTLLSYSRTFLSFAVAGVSLIQFFRDQAFVYFGYALIPIGCIIMGVGIFRYFRMRKRMREIPGTTADMPVNTMDDDDDGIE